MVRRGAMLLAALAASAGVAEAREGRALKQRMAPRASYPLPMDPKDDHHDKGIQRVLEEDGKDGRTLQQQRVAIEEGAM